MMLRSSLTFAAACIFMTSIGVRIDAADNGQNSMLPGSNSMTNQLAQVAQTSSYINRIRKRNRYSVSEDDEGVSPKETQAKI